MSLHVGDTVRLRSGGPIMTVEKAELYKPIKCCWFDGAELRRGEFEEKMLIGVKRGQPVGGSPDSGFSI